MKRILMMLLVLVAVGGTTDVCAQSWLKKLGKKAEEAAKRAVERNVENKVDKAVDDAMNPDQKKKKKDNSKGETYDNGETLEATNNQQNGKGGKTDAKSLEMTYAKSDFVPGDEIIFDDPMDNEQMGEFPSQWDLDHGNAEVASINGVKAIFFASGTVTIMPLMKPHDSYLPESFTIEMDIFIGDGSKISEEPRKYNTSRYNFRFYYNEDSYHTFYVLDDGKEVNWSFDREGRSDIDGSQNSSNLVNINNWNHLAISFNKRSFKAYINGSRVANVPNVESRPIRFTIGDIWDDHAGGYITNIRIAKGAVPLYDRMMSDGKFITYGITFDVGKSTIKPESMGEINRIVKLMTDNPDLKFSVEGHTDSTGNEASNQTLSEQRSQAIVAKLVELGISADRLTASGKGQSSPIADNSTDEGRAKNRRVEFVKQ